MTDVDARRARAADVLHRAEKFRASLGPVLRRALVHPYSLATASRWHTYPQWSLGNRRRLGVDLADLTRMQWDAMEALLRSALGTREGSGASAVLDHIAMDEYLGASGMGAGYGRGGFRIAFLGEPSASGRWELQFGGHHLAVANTYEGGVLVGATPSFRAIEPAGPVRWEGRTLDPMRRKRDAVCALLESLDSDQRAAAALPGRLDDLLVGPDSDGQFPRQHAGLAGRELTIDQRGLLADTIRAWVEDVDDEDAVPILEGYLAELDDTHLGIHGDAALASIGDAVRIDGPAVWIEYRMDEPYSTDRPHPHSVWRDRRTDYGGLGS